ncbi:WD40 repeat-like protein, partial [Leucogyrophana mollusca]
LAVPASRYVLAKRIKAHRDAIFSVAVSARGDFLASGGMDGAKIWDLRTYQQLAGPQQRHAHADPVSCTAWITRRDELRETLCYGTALGNLVIWRQQSRSKEVFEEVLTIKVGTGKEILCVSCDTSVPMGVRIATGTRDARVLVWSFDSRERIHSVFSVQLDNTIPKGIAFSKDTKDIFVFGLYNGYVHTMRGADGKILETFNLGTGGVAMNERQTQFVVDNAVDGLSLHRMSDGAYVRTFPIKSARAYPKQVAFVEQNRRIVGGGDQGSVYVFDRKNSMLVQTLCHAKDEMVQTVTAHDADGRSTIVAASSKGSGEATITVWTRH